MSFLEPLALIGLPLAALPVVIHLINQRRYQTINWGAMRFLLEASRMSRGYARIRQWLILLFRVLAMVLLLLAMSRPVTSGWLGLAGGERADTTLILLDRSPSMQQAGPAGGPSKLATGVAQLAATLGALGPSRYVLIDSATLQPREVASPEQLTSLSQVGPTSGSADLPALLQAAYDYIKTNRPGQADVWICSDLQANDWSAASGRWQTLRDGFVELQQGVRFHLLAYPETARDNLAIRVAAVRRVETGNETSLLVSLSVNRAGGEGKLEIPIRFEVEGARSEITVELPGAELTIKDHAIPLERDRRAGWGRVSLPADANPADNEFYFTFAEPAPRRTIVAAESGAATRPWELAAAISADAAIAGEVEFVEFDQLAAVAWEETALLAWQGALPSGAAAEAVAQFVGQGGQALFLPPATPAGGEFLGLRWTRWVEPPDAIPVDAWRSDQDLLTRTESGAALPIGELAVRRHCGLAGEHTPLATLRGGAPLLARAPTERGGAYFLATTAAVKDSSLASGGVALYVMVQRALARGAERLAKSQHLVAGSVGAESAATWRQLAGPADAISTEYAVQSGVYAAGRRTAAVNRGADEDRPERLSDVQVAQLFEGLAFDRVDDAAGNAAPLTREVWRLFLVSMIGAMLIEASLCLPKPPRAAGAVA